MLFTLIIKYENDRNFFELLDAYLDFGLQNIRNLKIMDVLLS